MAKTLVKRHNSRRVRILFPAATDEELRTCTEAALRKKYGDKAIRQGVKAAAGDAVNHPSHYNAGRFEVIDVIEDWQLGFCLGNTVKYIARAEHKGTTIQDLEKAAWYLAREIATRKKGQASQ